MVTRELNMSAMHEKNSGHPLFGQGHTKRNEDGAFRGAGGHFGLRTDPKQGPDLRALGGYGEFGWEGAGGFNGARAGFTLAGANNNPGAQGESGFWGGVNVGDANAGIYDDGSTFSAGYNAHLINGSVGYRTVDADSDHDRGAKAGLSYGLPSFGGRIHHGDADGDGNPEYGFGFHCPTGIVPGLGMSFDYTTETPGGDLASMGLGAALGQALIPIPGVGAAIGAGTMMAANWGMDAIGLGDYAPGTLMSNAGDWIAEGGIGRTASAVGDGISDAAGWVGDTASSIGGGIADAASSVGGAISSGASAAWSAVTSGW